jgi:type VI secretion system VasD/TssJ family lipoprotein
LLCLASCGSKTIQPPPEPRADYLENGITLDFKADPQLNRYQDKPHALHICVYQLTNPNALYQYSSDQSGISQLLQCTKFDPSVTMVKRVVMQPDTESTLVLDRAQGTRYVGFVAGYSELNKDNTVQLVKIPIVEETRGWIRRKTTRKLGLLEKTIELGPLAIQKTGEQ